MRLPRYRLPGVTGVAPPPPAGPGAHGPPIATRGPIGYAFVPIVVAAPGPTVVAGKVAPKSNTLPPTEETWTSKNKIPKRFKDRLRFATGGPIVGDIRQQGIGNCYLAGILGAMANTPKGRSRLVNMVTEQSGSIVTTGSEYIDGEAGPPKKVPADRYFEVTFAGTRSITVSDVLYADDSDRDWNPIFMDSPNKRLWPSVIELAYATMHGGYNKIGMSSGVDVATCIDEVLDKVDYTMLHFPTKRKFRRKKDDGPLKSNDLRDVCAKADSRAVMAATLKNATTMTANHAYVVVRLSGTSVTLYEPIKAEIKSVKLDDLSSQLEAVFSIAV